MQRRRALQVLGSLAALPALAGTPSDLLALGARVHASLDDARGYAPRVLTPEQYRAVTIAAERIIPRTDTPGATDARVADFIDAMLADWYAPAERDRFIAGLAQLETRPLAEIDAEVSALRATDERRANEHWFGMLKFLTVWGYYTSRAGIVDELRVDVLPGRYDGNAEYHAR